jgi:hypothetical protein
MALDFYETAARQVIFSLRQTGQEQALDVTTFPGDVTQLVNRIAGKGFQVMSECLNNRTYIFVGSYLHRRIYPVIRP